MKDRHSTELLKYEFTEEEKRDIASEMARKVNELAQAEAEKKAVNSQIKSKLDALTASIQEASHRYSNGYEMRNIKCRIIPDWIRKIWEYFREDTGEFAFSKPIDPSDYQLEINYPSPLRPFWDWRGAIEMEWVLDRVGT